jgi:hypothetical protein
MLYTTQINDLRKKRDLVRSNSEYDIITSKILNLAKKYNSLEYRDEYLIIGQEVYGNPQKIR